MKITGRVTIFLFSLVCFIVWNLDEPISSVSLVSFIFFGFIAWKLGKKYDKTKYLAYTDALTGLYNRHYVYEKFPKLLNRNQSKLGIFVIDCDNFKSINDLYGHQTGDWVLKRIAKLLNQQIRRKGIIARFGGDEFLVMVPFHDEKDIYGFVKQIEVDLFHLSEKTELNIRVSIGIAIFPNDGRNLNDLIRIADQNMYRHKGKKEVPKSETSAR